MEMKRIMGKRERETNSDTKPLLILDIAGVLIDGNAMTSTRKGLDEFLVMILQNYHVVSWTSRNRYKERKGKRVPAGESRTQHAFHIYRRNLLAEFYGEHTKPTSLMNGWKPVCLKDVDRVLEHPSVKELGLTRTDVVVVDDSPVKWALHDDIMCLHPPSWNKDDVDNVDLGPDGRIYQALSKSDMNVNDDYWKHISTDDVVEHLGGVEVIRSNVI